MGAGIELAARRGDGTEFPAEISLKSLHASGGPLVVAAIRDVSDRLEAQAERERLRADAERQRMESRLEQSQRLESLGQLAGGVAHDFNNLLAVISNYADFVADEITVAAQTERDRWEAVLHDVEQVRRAAERATALTRQLLAFGRREVVHPELIDVNEVVGDVQQLLRRTIGEHVELVASLAPALRPVMADPGRIEQVLVNLAVNARDAMPGGGQLSIETEDVDVDEGYAAGMPEVRTGAYVRLRVSDTGTGMPPAVVQHAFEPFFTTKPKGEGTGLGLATVYGIVTQAGGHVHIYSEPGIGTSLTVLLPAAQADPAAEPQTAPPSQADPAVADGATVLVVEDEEAMRAVTSRILRNSGYVVIATAGGSEAIAVAAEQGTRIDLLLSDVIMPGMLGREVADRIGELRPGTRVLFMSGYAQPVLASKGTLDAGVSLIEKPFSRAGLIDKVREALAP
jgi:signal transduction histidine kinase